MEATGGSAAKGKPRSEVRQKQLRVTFRLTAVEYAELEEAAEREGLTLASFARSRSLAAPTTRAIRRPPVDAQALSRLQAEMNRVGSNIYQLLKLMRFEGAPAARDELIFALAGYREAIAAITELRGRGKK